MKYFQLLLFILVSTNKVSAQSNEWETNITDFFNEKRVKQGKMKCETDSSLKALAAKAYPGFSQGIIDGSLSYDIRANKSNFSVPKDRNLIRIVAFKVLPILSDEEMSTKYADFVRSNILKRLEDYQTADIKGFCVLVKFSEIKQSNPSKELYLMTFDILLELPKPANFEELSFKAFYNASFPKESTAIFRFDKAISPPRF